MLFILIAEYIDGALFLLEAFGAIPAADGRCASRFATFCSLHYDISKRLIGINFQVHFPFQPYSFILFYASLSSIFDGRTVFSMSLSRSICSNELELFAVELLVRRSLFSIFNNFSMGYPMELGKICTSHNMNRKKISIF